MSELADLLEKIVYHSERILYAQHVHELKIQSDLLLEAMLAAHEAMGEYSYLKPQIAELEEKLKELPKYYS